MNTAKQLKCEEITDEYTGEDLDPEEEQENDGTEFQNHEIDGEHYQAVEFENVGYNRDQIMATFESSVLAGKRKSDNDFVERHNNLSLDCLRAHNQYRLIHYVEPLRLCRKLCKYSRDWARYLAKLGHIVRRHDCIYGENVFLVWPTKWEYTVRGTDPADYWYSGIGDYSFGGEPRNLLCLNFTQMVWRDTRRFGAAVARGDDGKIFVVAHYEPCGNIVGQFPHQVPAPAVLIEGPTESLLEEGYPARPFTAIEKECLHLHNELRYRHGVPFLTLNSGLNKTASAWAKKLCEEDRHAYRVDNPLGENVFFFVATDADMRARIGVQNAVDAWYSEMKHYIFGTEPMNNKARNFCQMLWRSTRKMGVAVATGRGGRVLIVANYYPRGNVVGQYRDNVFPVREDWTSETESPLPSNMSLDDDDDDDDSLSADAPMLPTEPFKTSTPKQSS